MIRKGWTDRILGWFCVIGVFAWVTSVEMRLSYDRQWRVAAQDVIRDFAVAERGMRLRNEAWDIYMSQRINESGGNLQLYFGPPDSNDAELIQAADGYGSGVDGPGIDDDAIRRLCESGRVCEVMGHQWQPCPVTWLADIDGMEEALDWRPRCGLCGKVKNERDYLE